jgi:hypothetical protein
MRHVLIVPFEEKESCKQLGGRWDPEYKVWYKENENVELEKYRPVELYVPFSEKENVKKAGGIWHKGLGSWIVPGYKLSECQQWVTDRRNYLKVPFDKANLVKTQGGKWDPNMKLWYIETPIPPQLKIYKSSVQRKNSDTPEVLKNLRKRLDDEISVEKNQKKLFME